MTDPLTFATGLLARGIEIVLRGNRLWVWPGKAYKHLSADEQQYIHDHRDELKEIARAKLLPETTVTWTPTIGDTIVTPTVTPTTGIIQPTAMPDAACKYCAPHVCVGEGSPWFPTLHYTDPKEIARRDAEASRIMLRQQGRRPW